jgi:hypothetical protein
VNLFDNTDQETPKPKGLGQYAAEKLAEFEAAKPVTATVKPLTVAQVNGNGASVFDQLDEHADWYDDILASAEWTEVKPGDSATLRAFRRPGATHPISAKVLKANPHVLVVWSEDAGLPSGAGQKLTKARTLADLHYSGDESTLAKALTRGDAIGLRPHVQDAVRSSDNITGDSEQRPENPEEYLEVKVVEEALKLKIRELARDRWAQEKAGETVLPDFIRLDEFLAQESVEEPQLIKGLWNKGTPVLFSAQFKAGKTTVRDNAVNASSTAAASSTGST